MGGSSVPSSTQAYQQVATGIWGSPEASALAKPILKPALASIKNQQDMLMGLQQGDPAQARKFFGLPETASAADISEQMSSHMRGPKIAMPSTPQEEQQAQQPKNYTRMAAEGGLMSLDDETPKDPRKFAKGGDSAPKDISKQQADTMARWQQQGNITPAKQRQIDNWSQQRQNYQNYQKDKTGVYDAARQAGLTPAGAYLGQAGYFGGELTKDPVTGKDVYQVTNPYYNQAISVLQGMNQQPQQFQQATQAYQDALSGLKSAAGFTPQQVSGAQVSRGQIRDIAAQQAEVERYKADMMQAPTEANVQNYRAAQAKLNQMQGPASWTQAGTAAQYMNPYTQNVLDQELFEANRQAQMRENQQRSQAAQQKAFGGTRAALQESEGRRNLGYLLSDIEQKGLQQAYGQGMQQFQAEQGLGAQVGQANLSAAQQTALANQQATNQQRQQYVNNALQAAMQSYGGQLTAAQQNQVAQNAASQFNAGAQNLAYNNYVAQQLAAQQSNQSMDWNVAQLNAQMAQQANLANQAAGLQANQQALGAYGQMAGIGQGLGSLGTQVGGYGQNLANLWGQAGGVLQGLGQNYFNQAQQNAANIWGGPATLAGQGIGILGGMGGGQSGVSAQTGQNVR